MNNGARSSYYAMDLFDGELGCDMPNTGSFAFSSNNTSSLLGVDPDPVLSGFLAPSSRAPLNDAYVDRLWQGETRMDSSSMEALVPQQPLAGPFTSCFDDIHEPSVHPPEALASPQSSTDFLGSERLDTLYLPDILGSPMHMVSPAMMPFSAIPASSTPTLLGNGVVDWSLLSLPAPTPSDFIGFLDTAIKASPAISTDDSVVAVPASPTMIGSPSISGCSVASSAPNSPVASTLSPPQTPVTSYRFLTWDLKDASVEPQPILVAQQCLCDRTFQKPTRHWKVCPWNPARQTTVLKCHLCEWEIKGARKDNLKRHLETRHVVKGNGKPGGPKNKSKKAKKSV